jgi:hypothetical protein
MSELGYVEQPVIQWLSGEGSPRPGDKGLGWTYRTEEGMAPFDRPLEDPIVEKLLVEVIIRINSEARPFALQVSLLVPLIAGLLGLITSLRMMRLPDPNASSAAEGMVGG